MVSAVIPVESEMKKNRPAPVAVQAILLIHDDSCAVLRPQRECTGGGRSG
jgi:hypothetical protein